MESACRQPGNQAERTFQLLKVHVVRKGDVELSGFVLRLGLEVKLLNFGVIVSCKICDEEVKRVISVFCETLNVQVNVIVDVVARY